MAAGPSLPMVTCESHFVLLVLVTHLMSQRRAVHRYDSIYPTMEPPSQKWKKCVRSLSFKRRAARKLKK